MKDSVYIEINLLPSNFETFNSYSSLIAPNLIYHLVDVK